MTRIADQLSNGFQQILMGSIDHKNSDADYSILATKKHCNPVRPEHVKATRCTHFYNSYPLCGISPSENKVHYAQK